MIDFRFLYAFLLVAFFSCSSNENKSVGGSKEQQSKNVIIKDDPVEVKIEEAKYGDFYAEILSNGKGDAYRNTELRFLIPGFVKKILIKSGTEVKAGQPLVLLDDTEFQKRLIRSRENLERSLIDLDDRLIDYGFRLKDSSKVPEEIMKVAKIRSGFVTAKYDYADAKAMLDKTFLRAPFDGKITNLDIQTFDQVDGGKKICNIIDDRQMQIEFSVLESEFDFVSVGAEIRISPYGEAHEVSGKVIEISPNIDENGLIRVRGIARNQNRLMIDGMSMKIVVRKSLGKQLYIPKESILQRQGRDVVFTFEEGRAKWNYVETSYRNSRFICIKSGIREGQKVIITNNGSLANDSEVIQEIE